MAGRNCVRVCDIKSEKNNKWKQWKSSEKNRNEMCTSDWSNRCHHQQHHIDWSIDIFAAAAVVLLLFVEWTCC